MVKNSHHRVFISVIVPVYNVEKYLKQCVDSILEQTFNDYELILVDDGSKDSSPQICDDYATQNEHVYTIHQPNGGQVKARITGLEKATGEYVFFVDSDDWIEPNALEIVSRSAKDNNADIITFDSYFCYTDNHKLPVGQSVPSGVFNKQQMIEKIYPKMIYSGRFFYFGIYAAMWNKVFRRSLLYPNIINVDPRLRIGEDGVTTFASFLDAKKICVLGTYHLYNYRDNNASITKTYCPNQFDNARLLIRTLQDINKKKNVFDLSSQIDYYLMYNVYSIFIEEFYYRYKKSFLDRFRYLSEISRNSFVQETIQKIDYKSMPSQFRLFFASLKSGTLALIIITSMAIAYKKRLKIYIKKLLGKY